MKILKDRAIHFLLKKAFKEEVENFYANNTAEHTIEDIKKDFDNQFQKWLLYHEFITQDEYDFLQMTLVEPQW